jgi:hypothetical protein
MQVHRVERDRGADERERRGPHATRREREQQHQANRSVQRAEDPQLRIVAAEHTKEQRERVDPKRTLRAPKLVAIALAQLERAEHRVVPGLVRFRGRLGEQLARVVAEDGDRRIRVELDAAQQHERRDADADDDQHAVRSEAR